MIGQISTHTRPHMELDARNREFLFLVLEESEDAAAAGILSTESFKADASDKIVSPTAEMFSHGLVASIQMQFKIHDVDSWLSTDMATLGKDCCSSKPKQEVLHPDWTQEYVLYKTNIAFLWSYGDSIFPCTCSDTIKIMLLDIH